MGREPQQDRSRATRARLLEATVHALAESGWSGTTVAGVAERAGVTRGAAQHHFPTREDLVAGALAHMADTWMASLPSTTDHPPGPARTHEVVAATTAVYSGAVFRATVQLWSAAASDAGLREQIVTQGMALRAGVYRAVVRMLGVDEARPGVTEAVQATLDFARGLGLTRLLVDDPAHRARVVQRYAAMLHADLVGLGAVPSNPL